MINIKKIRLLFVLIITTQILSCSNGLNDALDERDVTINPWARTVNPAAAASTFVSTAVDKDGYVYAAGYVAGNGQYKFGDIELDSAGRMALMSNCVIVKYSPAGKALWARTLSASSSASFFKTVATDSEGNVYAAGTIGSNGVYNFGAELTNGAFNGINAVIVKYSSDGKNIWAKTTSAGYEASNFESIAIDSNGNIYAAGSINCVGTFNSYKFGNVSVHGVYNPSSGDGSNPLLVKYDKDGNCINAVTAASATNQSVFNSVAVDKDDNVYTAGNVTRGESVDSFNFGSGVVLPPCVSAGNAVIVKYNSSLTNLWVKMPSAASGNSTFESVTSDSKGDLYTAGFITGKDTVTGFDFGSGKISGISSNANAVIVKYNSEGTNLWAKTVVSGYDTGISSYNSLTIDSDGNICSVGSFKAATGLDFGTGMIHGMSTGNNVILVKYNKSGTAISALTAVKASSYSYYFGIAADKYGSIYCSGYINTNATVNFGSNDVQGGFATGANAVLVKYR